MDASEEYKFIAPWVKWVPASHFGNDLIFDLHVGPDLFFNVELPQIIESLVAVTATKYKCLVENLSNPCSISGCRSMQIICDIRWREKLIPFVGLKII